MAIKISIFSLIIIIIIHFKDSTGNFNGKYVATFKSTDI